MAGNLPREPWKRVDQTPFPCLSHLPAFSIGLCKRIILPPGPVERVSPSPFSVRISSLNMSFQRPEDRNRQPFICSVEWVHRAYPNISNVTIISTNFQKSLFYFTLIAVNIQQNYYWISVLSLFLLVSHVTSPEL